MKINRILVLALAAVAIRGLCPAAIAEEEKEEKLSLDQIPAAAASALKDAAAGATITSVELDDEDGKKKGYEAAFTLNGHKHEVSVTADGKIYATEDVIPLGDAPAAVKTAIEKQAGGASVSRVEKAVEDGKTTYEAKIGKTEYEYNEDGSLAGKEGAESDEKD